MKHFSSTQIKNNWGSVQDAARQSPVSITSHGRPTFVVLDNQEYQDLVTAKYELLKDDIRAGIDDIENENFSERSVDEIIKKAKSQKDNSSRK
jgi:prevent-host-death family protein